jgi:hypothetical protein
MIKTIADLLRELMVKEAAKLDDETITHGPTIGSMYEGLARDILDRVIPGDLDVRVVDGFIEGVDGSLSPQLDAMVVTGKGRQLPYTTNFVWPIADVIAAFEVSIGLGPHHRGFVAHNAPSEWLRVSSQSVEQRRLGRVPTFPAEPEQTSPYAI